MKIIRRFNQLLLIAVMLCTCSVASARWATFEDADVEVIKNDWQITINADGTSERIVHMQFKIINESGRDSYAKYPLYYNHDNSTLEIISAKTIVGNKEYPIKAELIEDKPMASSVNGFDQTHQILLAFPNVQIGSIISLQFKDKILHADVPGLFECFIAFDQRYYQHANISIKSALPLYVDYNNLNQYLSVQQGKTSNFYTLDVKLTKPIYIKIVDETTDLINPKRYPWIFVTTVNDWTVLSKELAIPYDDVLKQPLPSMYKQIVEQAAKQPNAKQQIELAMAMLNENVQYMGDWKTSKGRHVAQDLAEVANRRLGDCKDFATGTVAIMRQLGFKANVVFVERGVAEYDNSFIKLPGMTHFNHAMARLEKAGKVYWVDPTNFFSISTVTLPDIADRRALVLDGAKTHLEHIPQSSPEQQTVISSKTLDLLDPNLVAVQGTLQLQGMSAVKYTGSALRVSKSTIDNYIIYEQGNYDNILDKHVESPKLDSRIVSDLKFTYKFKEKNMVLNTNAGNAIQISNGLANSFVFNDEQVSDVYLGAPSTVKSVIILKNISPVNTKSLNCEIKSPWLDAKRVVKYGEDSVVIEQEFVIKAVWLDNSTIQSPEYKKVAADLAKNFKEGFAIVFN